MFIELKELDVNKGNIYDPNQYPEDGMYLASDGITTFIVTVSKQANVCLSLPVALDLVKRHEAEKAEEKAKVDLNIGLYSVQNKLDKIVGMLEIDNVPFESKQSTLLEHSKNTVCLSEGGLINLVNAIKGK